MYFPPNSSDQTNTILLLLNLFLFKSPLLLLIWSHLINHLPRTTFLISLFILSQPKYTTNISLANSHLATRLNRAQTQTKYLNRATHHLKVVCTVTQVFRWPCSTAGSGQSNPSFIPPVTVLRGHKPQTSCGVHVLEETRFQHQMDLMHTALMHDTSYFQTHASWSVLLQHAVKASSFSSGFILIRGIEATAGGSSGTSPQARPPAESFPKLAGRPWNRSKCIKTGAQLCVTVLWEWQYWSRNVAKGSVNWLLT